MFVENSELVVFLMRMCLLEVRLDVNEFGGKFVIIDLNLPSLQTWPLPTLEGGGGVVANLPVDWWLVLYEVDGLDELEIASFDQCPLLCGKGRLLFWSCLKACCLSLITWLYGSASRKPRSVGPRLV